MAKNFLRQVHRHRADRDRSARDIRPGANLFRDPEGALEKPVQKRTGRPGFAGRGVGFLRLAENLGLADHHRIEPGSNAEKMLHALLCLVPVEDFRFILQRIHPRREQALYNPLRRHRLLGRGVDFDAIAGGEQERLRTTHFLTQPPVHLSVADETLARLHAGRVMADPDAKKIH